MKKLPSIRSLYQSAARSERQSKTWKAPGPAASMTSWMASVKLSNPSAGEIRWISAPEASSSSGSWRAKRK